jgi:hypothetical protein
MLSDIDNVPTLRGKMLIKPRNCFLEALKKQLDELL